MDSTPMIEVEAAKALHWKKRGDTAHLGLVVSEQHRFFLRRFGAATDVKMR